MSTNICHISGHQYQTVFDNCTKCDSGYVACNNCDGDGCLEEYCDKGITICSNSGCKYGYIYQHHYCINCGIIKLVPPVVSQT